MCCFCKLPPRCQKCGEPIENSDLNFSEAIADDTIVPRILAQPRVCNECKLEQIQAADNSRLAYYKSGGMKNTAIKN